MTAKTAYLRHLRMLRVPTPEEAKATASRWNNAPHAWYYQRSPRLWWKQLSFHEKAVLTHIPQWLQK